MGPHLQNAEVSRVSLDDSAPLPESGLDKRWATTWTRVAASLAVRITARRWIGPCHVQHVLLGRAIPYGDNGFEISAARVLPRVPTPVLSPGNKPRLAPPLPSMPTRGWRGVFDPSVEKEQTQAGERLPPRCVGPLSRVLSMPRASRCPRGVLVRGLVSRRVEAHPHRPPPHPGGEAESIRALRRRASAACLASRAGAAGPPESSLGARVRRHRLAGKPWPTSPCSLRA